MSRRLRGQRGMSLVEATIILLVLMLLTAVFSVSIFDFVKDAQAVKVKEDCEALGITVARFVRDNGPCFRFAAATGCTKSNRVDILYSDGPDVLTSDLVGDATSGFLHADIQGGGINWSDEGARGDTLEHQFVTNSAAYTTPSGYTPPSWLTPGPAWHLGWRGAYISSPLGSDPWGKRYLINTTFMAVATDGTDGTGEGQRRGGWDHDVFCLSAGFNNRYETFYGGSTPFTGGTNRGGDDFIYVISGGTR